MTLAECGQAAGYSRGLAAHYFGSRDELIGAIARYIVGRYSKSLRTTGPAAKQESEPKKQDRKGLEGLLDRVQYYIEHSRDISDDTRAFHVVLGAAFNTRPLSDAIAELNRKSIAWYASFIREGIEAGEIRPDVSPTLQAALLLASTRGIISQWLVDPDLDLDQACKEFINNLRLSLKR